MKIEDHTWIFTEPKVVKNVRTGQPVGDRHPLAISALPSMAGREGKGKVNKDLLATSSPILDPLSAFAGGGGNVSSENTLGSDDSSLESTQQK